MNITKQTPIAVVGVSHDPEKYGAKIFRDLVKAGYQVVGVNPKGGQVAGQELFVNLSAIQPKPELVITVVPPVVTEQVVAECLELGIRQIWMQPGSESPTAIKLAKENKLEVISQACFMVQQQLW
ncbi:MAG: CoA-binding protein [Candidatus Pacebacteria bacterium]|nr:CoA-binding protein [Candidatus Paceibacterota bacterium]